MTDCPSPVSLSAGLSFLAALSLRPFLHGVEILVERLLQLLGQFRDFLGRGAALQGFAQGLFRRPKVTFGLGAVAVLDVQGHFPEEIDDRDEFGVVAGVAQGIVGEAQPEIDAWSPA